MTAPRLSLPQPHLPPLHLLLALAVTASALAAGLGAAWLLLAKSLGIDFLPDWGSLIGLAVGAIAVTIGAALLAALPALNARPATALRAL